VAIAATKLAALQVAAAAGLDLPTTPDSNKTLIVEPAAVAGQLARTVHVVAFCDEEGVRFQSTFLGSRALVRQPGFGS
jgi:hypothetical protein